MTRSQTSSRALYRFCVFTLSFDWFTGLSVVCDSSEWLLWFWLTLWLWKPLFTTYTAVAKPRAESSRCSLVPWRSLYSEHKARARSWESTTWRRSVEKEREGEDWSSWRKCGTQQPLGKGGKALWRPYVPRGTSRIGKAEGEDPGNHLM